MKKSIVVLIFSLLIFSEHVKAQGVSIVMTEPATPTTVHEGDDYFKSQLLNPRDFNQISDAGFERNHQANSVGVDGGIWSGNSQPTTTTDPDTSSAYFLPLVAGDKTGLNSIPIQTDKNGINFGLQNPVVASKYNLLSFRMKAGDPSDVGVSWEDNINNSKYIPLLASSSKGTYKDGFTQFTFVRNYFGWYVYSFDMTDLSKSFSASQGQWINQIYALRIDPSISGQAGFVNSIDWLRLVDPNSGPDVRISWQTTDPNPNASTVYTLYIDNDNTGFDGTPIAVFPRGADPQTYTIKSAMLPPGVYYFYINRNVLAGAAPVTAGLFSDYSKSLTVNAAPGIAFGSPSSISGEDYATSVRGDTWDMQELTDVENTDGAKFTDSDRNFTQASIVQSGEAFLGGKLFEAKTATQTNSSEPFTFSNRPSLQFPQLLSTPIDPLEYRYLNYRMKVDTINHPSSLDRENDKFSTSFTYWNTGPLVDAGRGKTNIVFKDWKTYSIDLWDTKNLEGQNWHTLPSISTLRITPAGPATQTLFQLDYVTLTKENKATQDQFVIQMTFDDIDNSTLNADIYYDTDNQGYDGTLIQRLQNIPQGINEVTWDTSSIIAGGRFYIYAVVTDGFNVSKNYSPAEVIVPSQQYKGPAPMDYDGDGTSDRTVYRPSNGKFYQRRSSTNQLVSVPWVVGDKFFPLQGDFNADKKADLAVIFEHFGYMGWYTHFSGTSTVKSYIWGYPTDQKVVADYNGNGADEIGVYRNGLWYLIDDVSGGVSTIPWGMTEDVPVPADYDGDGKDDIAVWRPSEGNWYILNSGYATGDSDVYARVVQWGLPGDVPLRADWDGDGLVDFAVWRPSTGTWYVKNTAKNSITIKQWGLPNDIPMVGDYDGDKRIDFTVFRPTEANWYTAFRNNGTGVQQMGLASDRLPRR